MSDFPKLEAIRRLDLELVDEPTQACFDEHTVCGLEEKKREFLRDWMPVFRAVVEVFREHGLNTDSVMDSAARLVGVELKVECYFNGAERGSRVGAQRGLRMVSEAGVFGRNNVRNMLTGLYGDAGADDD